MDKALKELEVLKPCPFCGGEAKEHDGSIKDSCFCSTEECFMFVRIIPIKAWNTRDLSSIRLDEGKVYELLLKGKSNFKNPHHYTLREQVRMTKEDASALASKSSELLECQESRQNGTIDEVKCLSCNSMVSKYCSKCEKRLSS